MAVIFFSFQNEDKHIATRLAPLLQERGHRVGGDWELPIGAAWRDQLMGDLLSSDAVVVIWSAHTWKSQFVPAEVGVVRASPQLHLLPVLLGDIEIPRFIGDLLVDRIMDTETATLDGLAARLDDSIRKHLESRAIRKRGRPRVFISHRHKDEKIVRALTECMQTYFHVDKQDIRCTSVRPYRLPVGANTAERLRDEIADAEVVLGVLGTDTLASTYVAFELGAAWGQRVWTCPLLAGGADQSHIPDPIRDLSPLFLERRGDCFQLLRDMEGFTTLVRRKDMDETVLADKVDALVDAARPEAHGTP